jgi:hypothetical protein
MHHREALRGWMFWCSTEFSRRSIKSADPRDLAGALAFAAERTGSCPNRFFEPRLG